jgi:alpha-1,3-rhamnosyl/mannosyltransferase
VKPLRVAVGTTVLQHGAAANSIDGIGTYTQHLLAEYADMHASVQTLPFRFTSYRRPWSKETNQLFPFGLGAAVSAATGLSHIGIRHIANQCDVIHATDHLVPRARKCPVVATLMDAIPLSHPQWVRVRLRWLKSALWRSSARNADHIVTISEYSKQQIHQWFGIPNSRISVVPLGVDRRYFDGVDDVERERVRRKLELPHTFFLILGTIQPRKNVERVIAAHLALPDKHRREFPLVIAGRYGWGVDSLHSTLTRLSNDGPIRWLRYVTEADKLALLQTASALVFPSLYEGFGLPVLEAFAGGTPLITSNVTAIPEVADRESALIVDPTKVDEISNAMLETITNKAGCLERAVHGRTIAERHTWERCARETLAAYRTVI